jgi:hypothetical protein
MKAAGLAVTILPEGWLLVARSPARARARDAHPLMIGQPRPTNGIMLAMTVMNSTLVSSGRLAM